MTFGWALAGVCWLLAVMMLAMPVDYEGVDSDGDGVDDDCDLYPFDPDRTDDTGLCYSSEESERYSMISSSLCCCLSGFLCLLIVNSGRKARDAAQTQVIYIPQQPVQQVVHQTYIQQQTPVVQQQPVPAVPASPAKSQAQWAMEARNFEVALNWDKAAESYEKAGLFEEAGRVRQIQMEKGGSGVNIHVKSGDTYHDSVVMKDDDKQL
tara:strand:- start:179 stop:805 length:627 start_codon:yes stop_codon:yes gene_type:complete